MRAWLTYHTVCRWRGHWFRKTPVPHEWDCVAERCQRGCGSRRVVHARKAALGPHRNGCGHGTPGKVTWEVRP